VSGLRIAVFGLGEAGGNVAGDLAERGFEVHAYEPRSIATPAGVNRHADPSAAVVGVDAVFAFTASADAPGALEQAFDAISRSAVYADFSTSSAGVKQKLAQRCASTGVRFADVAMMSPVPGKGMYTPMLVSGTGADRFMEMFAPAGFVVEHSGDVAGTAATRKLLRSVVIKGVEQFTAADGVFLRRIVEGTGTHSLRRLHEMEATAELLGELGVDPLMTRSTVESLQRINQGWTLPELPLT
jgi:3-hydroxyisobutyrate dehydrogenase-like beta-hydroxyacid dehydrogenase